MGITDLFSDLIASVTFQEAHAEAPAPAHDEESRGEGADEGEDDEASGSVEGGDDDAAEESRGGEEEGAAEEEEAEEEEEEDDEPVDLKPKLEEGQSSMSCHHGTTHYQLLYPSSPVLSPSPLFIFRLRLHRIFVSLSPRPRLTFPSSPQNAHDPPNAPPTDTITTNASSVSPQPHLMKTPKALPKTVWKSVSLFPCPLFLLSR
jgi:hypothetical protein